MITARGMSDERQAAIAANLETVRSRIAAACAAVGRKPAEITLIAVTKTYPADDVLRLVALGVTDVGENKDQEASAKAAVVAGAGARPRWHFIGRLQRNKAKSVVTYADVVHSVDSVELARVLAGQALQRRDEPLDALVQVSLDDDPGRGGAPGDRFLAVAAEVAGARSLRLAGLMAVAPLDEPAEIAFAKLARYITLFQADHPDATIVSAGMSNDLDQAIAAGATHVRVGSALLGKRLTLG